jgi:hypothetical protein
MAAVTAEIDETRGRALSSETALVLPPDLSFERWVEYGKSLGRFGRAWQWWVGDWLVFGDRTYGDKHIAAIEATGYRYSTLNKLRWVAERVELVRRRTDLSFAHHQEVARLAPAEQDRWLDLAARERWSASRLRRELRPKRAASMPVDGWVRRPEGWLGWAWQVSAWARVMGVSVEGPEVYSAVGPDNFKRVWAELAKLDELMARAAPRVEQDGLFALREQNEATENGFRTSDSEAVA